MQIVPSAAFRFFEVILVGVVVEGWMCSDGADRDWAGLTVAGVVELLGDFGGGGCVVDCPVADRDCAGLADEVGVADVGEGPGDVAAAEGHSLAADRDGAGLADEGGGGAADRD